MCLNSNLSITRTPGEDEAKKMLDHNVILVGNQSHCNKNSLAREKCYVFVLCEIPKAVYPVSCFIFM